MVKITTAGTNTRVYGKEKKLHFNSNTFVDTFEPQSFVVAWRLKFKVGKYSIGLTYLSTSSALG